ncbi:hypothetical protein CA13_37330 [Planctomycetes bacterium CA13]|uniref:Uncharacterized protein n=2 Tax=Novipirellula herctigrandis TaxID=2527986 RepID=A0A5C5Z624_9BACT|nr:hypothetical protein CA13_37330 [Planctomycetes bacterium CA13]
MLPSAEISTPSVTRSRYGQIKMVRRVSLAILIASTGLSTAFHSNPLWSQQPGTLRPVPKMGFEDPTSAAAPVHNPQHDGWNLKWRRSDSITPLHRDPADRELANQDPFAEDLPRPQSAQPAIVATASSLSNAIQVAAPDPLVQPIAASQTTVSQAAWNTPQQGGGFELPQENLPTDHGNGLRDTQTGEPDFFENPFGSASPKTQTPQPKESSSQSGGELKIPADPVRPSESRSMNQLRGGAGNELAPPKLPDPKSNAPNDSGPSLGEMLREQPPSPKQDRDDDLESLPDLRGEPIESPSDRSGPFESPFGRDRKMDSNRNRFEDNKEDDWGDEESSQDELKKDMGLTCEDFRSRIAGQTIDKVSLDISPPFRPDVISESEYQKLKTKFDQNQTDRQWRSIDGRPLASGRLVDLAYEKALIQTSYGTTEEVSINRLSEPDLAYISQNWGLPKECLIEQVAYVPRSWQSTTMTWKASNLCHKPLYFEDVNLERYGHTRGPLWEPVVSSAHFFANIAVLPYKMGVHTPHECQYALGYYRPGNCAPWIKPPVPISVRGGLTQAAVMTGAFWLIP